MRKEINYNNKKFEHIGNTGSLLIYAYEDFRILADVAGNVIYEYSMTTNRGSFRKQKINISSNK